MKLLMITNKVDRIDPLAGFAYSWVKKLTNLLMKDGSQLFVICNEKGDLTDLGKNIEIYSLGKEKGASRLRRYFTFAKLALKLVPKVDGIFCHMNPEYTIAISSFAKLYRKKIATWFTYGKINTDVVRMEKFADIIFSASAESFPLKSNKVVFVGNSIDVDFFKPSLNPAVSKFDTTSYDGGRLLTYKILNIGKIIPNKNYETLIKALDIIINQKKLTDIKLIIINGAADKESQNELEKIRELVNQKELRSYVEISGKISNYETVKFYQDADVFVNLSSTSSISKTVLEAMACGTLVLTSNQNFTKILPANLLYNFNDVADLAQKIIDLKNLDLIAKDKLKENLRAEIVKNHNLNNVIEKIINYFKK